MGFWNRIRRGIEALLYADTPDGDLIDPFGSDVWSSLEARRLRYAMAWASYQNTTYSDIHSWARDLKHQAGLYRYIRSIYNPVYRLVEFHAAHVFGGRIDPAAGDGTDTPSALPILSDNAAIRPALAQVWRDSQWDRNKAIYTRLGALSGDVALKVVDDPARGAVYLSVVAAKHLKWYALDPWGSVKGYVIEESRPDPRQTRPGVGSATIDDGRTRYATYEEHCYREGDEVRFETYLIDGGDARPWDWRSYPEGTPEAAKVGPEWSEPYGFVPLVFTQHINANLGAGMAEHHVIRTKVQECDDLASKLHDQARKAIDGGWLFTGMSRPSSKLKPSRRDADDDPNEGRDSDPIVYSTQPDARAYPLIAPLDIAGTIEALRDQFDQVERDFPELRFDRLRASGDVSGETLRVAREPVEDKVEERRATYDADLARAQMMALSIGGHRHAETSDPRLKGRLAAFAPFGLDSYRAGDLDHAIGPRPVFRASEADRIATRTAVYGSIEAGGRAGLPRATLMREAGYTDDQIAAIDRQAESESDKAAERIRRQQEAFGAAEDEEDDAEGDDTEGQEDRG